MEREDLFIQQTLPLRSTRNLAARRLDSRTVWQHYCVKCHKRFRHVFSPFCDCGGMLDVQYDLQRVVLRDSINPLERFIDLLPVEDPATLAGQRFEYTPCVHARRLGARLGMPWLYLKNETVLPTSTTKDRMAVVSLAYLGECGVRAFCTSSTGNSSTAYAHAITRFPNQRMVLFTAEGFQDRVQHAENSQVVQFVLRDATFTDASNCASEFATRRGLVAELGFFNPGRREGLKLAFLEAAEQVSRPIHWYVQAVSSAMGVYGAYKGAKELLGLRQIRCLPRLLCVQQETCAPMVRAWEDGSPTIESSHIFPRPTGIAQAILRGNPTKAYPYVRRIVMESGGTFVSVSEQEIRDARRMTEDLEGISPCFSAAAALAGLVRLVRDYGFTCDESVVINLTGGDRPAAEPAGNVHWLRRSPSGWIPEDPDDALTRSAWEDPVGAMTAAENCWTGKVAA